MRLRHAGTDAAILRGVMEAEPVVLIALGSNIRPDRNLPRAVELLARELEIVAASPVYGSPPVGAPGTPEFLNAVIRVRVHCGPRTLKFALLRAVEGRLGRRRGRDRNAPREIDLDLVLYGNRVEAALDLQLPDPGLLTEAHIAVPAANVAGEAVHPVDGRLLRDIAAGLDSRLVERPDIVLRPFGARSERLR